MPVIPITERHYMKRGDLLPALRAQLFFESGKIVDLTNATGVTFSMRLPRSLTNKVDKGPCIIVTDSIEDIDPTDGIVQYAWEPDDTDVAGEFIGEFEVTMVGGGSNVMTVPNAGYFSIEIAEDLS